MFFEYSQNFFAFNTNYLKFKMFYVRVFNTKFSCLNI